MNSDNTIWVPVNLEVKGMEKRLKNLERNLTGFGASASKTQNAIESNTEGKREGSGRPKSERPKVTTINIRLEPDLAARAKAAAKERGITLSELIRRYLDTLQ